MDKKPTLDGKVYLDYLAEDEKRNGPRRRARMQAAIDAMKARKEKGVDISINKKKFNTRTGEDTTK